MAPPDEERRDQTKDQVKQKSHDSAATASAKINKIETKNMYAVEAKKCEEKASAGNQSAAKLRDDDDEEILGLQKKLPEIDTRLQNRSTGQTIIRRNSMGDARLSGLQKELLATDTYLRNHWTRRTISRRNSTGDAKISGLQKELLEMDTCLRNHKTRRTIIRRNSMGIVDSLKDNMSDVPDLKEEQEDETLWEVNMKLVAIKDMRNDLHRKRRLVRAARKSVREKHGSMYRRSERLVRVADGVSDAATNLVHNAQSQMLDKGLLCMSRVPPGGSSAADVAQQSHLEPHLPSMETATHRERLFHLVTLLKSKASRIESLQAAISAKCNEETELQCAVRQLQKRAALLKEREQIVRQSPNRRKQFMLMPRDSSSDTLSVS